MPSKMQVGTAIEATDEINAIGRHLDLCVRQGYDALPVWGLRSFGGERVLSFEWGTKGTS